MEGALCKMVINGKLDKEEKGKIPTITEYFDT